MRYKHKHLIKIKQADEVDFNLLPEYQTIEINVGYMGDTEYDWEDEVYTTKFVVDQYNSVTFIDLDENCIKFLDKKFGFLTWVNREILGIHV